MSWGEFWWIMRHDTRARNDFIRGIGLPFGALILFYAVIMLGVVWY